MGKFKALVMNAVEQSDRRLGCGVLIVNTESGRPMFIGKNALSKRLKDDYEKAAAYVDRGVARLSYPNQLTAFQTDSAYYKQEKFSVWQQDIGFEPKANLTLYVDKNSLNILPERNEATEEVELMLPLHY